MRVKIFLLISVLTVQFSFSQKCIDGDCENGFGILKESETLYIGFFYDGMKNGAGVLKNNDGVILYGEFIANTLTGFSIVFNNTEFKAGLLFNNDFIKDRYVYHYKTGKHFPMDKDGKLAAKGYLDKKSGDCLYGDCNGGWSTSNLKEGFITGKYNGSSYEDAPLIVSNFNDDIIKFQYGQKTNWLTVVLEKGIIVLNRKATKSRKEQKLVITNSKIGYIDGKDVVTYKLGSHTEIYTKFNTHINGFKKSLKKARFGSNETNEISSLTNLINSDDSDKPTRRTNNSFNYWLSRIEKHLTFGSDTFPKALEIIEEAMIDYPNKADLYGMRAFANMNINIKKPGIVDDIKKGLKMSDNKSGYSSLAAGTLYILANEIKTGCEHIKVAKESSIIRSNKQMLKSVQNLYNNKCTN